MSSPLRPAGPGRPKDPEKRASILAAAKCLFANGGYAGITVDAIAQAAGVSKLTVYSHFRDKEALFTAAIKARCEELLPHEAFLPRPHDSLRDQLLTIARGFLSIVNDPESISFTRLMMAEARNGSPLGRLFYEAGPARTIEDLAGFLAARCREGAMTIPDPRAAACHFFNMLKGEHHLQLLVGYRDSIPAEEQSKHAEAVVDLFLCACGTFAETGRPPGSPPRHRHAG